MKSVFRYGISWPPPVVVVVHHIGDLLLEDWNLLQHSGVRRNFRLQRLLTLRLLSDVFVQSGDLRIYHGI